MDQPIINAPAPSPMPTAPVAHVFPSSHQLLKQAWAIYKARFWHLISILLIWYAVIFAGALILGFSGAITQVNNQIKLSGAGGGALFALFIAIAVYISIFCYAALLHNIMVAEDSQSIGAAFTMAQGDIWPLFLTGLLSGLAILGGTILLVVPGIIFSFWFSQATFVVIDSKLKGPAALKQSKMYVKGNVGQIFKKGFYIGLILIVIAVAIAIIFGIAAHGDANNIVLNIVLTIFRILATPLAAVYAYLLYKELKASKASVT